MRECWLPAFSPFFTMFSKGFLYRVIKSRDCVVKGEPLSDDTKLKSKLKASAGGIY